jgi:hypothetical protein
MKVSSLIKISRFRRFGFDYVTALFCVVIFAVLLPFGAGATQQITQSYATDGEITIGSIVSIKNSTNDTVVLANNNNVGNMMGVVVNPTNSVLSVTSDQKNSAEVATSGVLQVLVSDINGAIASGDQVTASPIDGVGMKASQNVRVIGIAQSALNSTNGSKESYTDKDGVKKSVLIGQIPLQVAVSYYFKEPDKTIVPAAIQNIANTLAGKPVSTLPILISIAIFIITIVVVVSIVFAMVRSSIISVGRNPMSQSAIYRDLIQLSALVMAILAVGMISIYLVLTRM